MLLVACFLAVVAACASFAFAFIALKGFIFTAARRSLRISASAAALAAFCNWDLSAESFGLPHLLHVSLSDVVRRRHDEHLQAWVLTPDDVLDVFVDTAVLPSGDNGSAGCVPTTVGSIEIWDSGTSPSLGVGWDCICAGASGITPPPQGPFHAGSSWACFVAASTAAWTAAACSRPLLSGGSVLASLSRAQAPQRLQSHGQALSAQYGQAQSACCLGLLSGAVWA